MIEGRRRARRGEADAGAAKEEGTVEKKEGRRRSAMLRRNWSRKDEIGVGRPDVDEASHRAEDASVESVSMVDSAMSLDNDDDSSLANDEEGGDE